jgi:signal transduction histidine kinase
MRAMVGVLRRHDPAELAPTPTIADVERLASAPAAGPPVRLEVTGDLHALAPAVETAVFRLVQESVTNARRHARRASTITVSVHGDGAGVDVCVADDGEQVTDRVSTGYGIIGMVERAGCSGGSCEAGPGPHGGWVVRARLPRRGGAA